MISSSCYEHKNIIGVTYEWMTECETELLETCRPLTSNIYAWCLLPNHYHLLLQTERLQELRRQLGKLHGRTSFKWNGEDNQRGRKVWHNGLDGGIKSHRHFWASVNYIHHNPVHHEYVDKWQDWPWSSAAAFVKRVGHITASKIWRQFPLLDYGKTWDANEKPD